jgi:hypothetical protein
MKMMRVSVVCAVLVVWALAAAGAEQKPAGTGAKAEAVPKAKGMPFYGKVGAVDRTANTLALEGKEKKRLFYVTSATKIHRDKQPARLEDVAVGQWVGGFVRPDANGRPIVENLNLAVTQRNAGSTATNTVRIGGAGRK